MDKKPLNFIKLAKDRYKSVAVRPGQRLTMKAVNAEIQKKYPTVELVKGEGYFYLYSEDEVWGTKISSLYTASIYVYKLNELTLEQWMEDVDALLKQPDLFSGQ